MRYNMKALNTLKPTLDLIVDQCIISQLFHKLPCFTKTPPTNCDKSIVLV